MKGVIKSIEQKKGYGFIRADNGRDYFFHQSSFTKKEFSSLSVGDKVSFDFARTSKGTRAVNIKILSSRRPAGGR